MALAYVKKRLAARWRRRQVWIACRLPAQRKKPAAAHQRARASDAMEELAADWRFPSRAGDVPILPAGERAGGKRREEKREELEKGHGVPGGLLGVTSGWAVCAVFCSLLSCSVLMYLENY